MVWTGLRAEPYWTKTMIDVVLSKCDELHTVNRGVLEMNMTEATYNFRPVHHIFDQDHKVEFALPFLAIKNSVAEQVEKEIDLELQPVALRAINGVLFFGNVEFVNNPNVNEFVLIENSQPILELSGASSSWKLSINGLDQSGEAEVLDCTLTDRVVMLQIQHNKLYVRFCES